MKKLFFFFFFFSFIHFTSNAQLIFGLRGGVSSTFITTDDIITSEYSIESLNEATIGFHAGLFSRIQLFSLFIQPEFLFTSTSNNIEITDLIGGGLPVIKKQIFNKIDIPFLAGYQFGPARVELGPVASIIINSKSELKDITGYEEKFNKATYGYQIGFGLDISEFVIDLKYEGNLSKLGDGIYIGGVERSFDSRASQVIISLGFFF